MKHWLVKQEPDTYPFSQLVADGRTAWTGVRNYQARNFLREMCVGDAVLYYHSVGEKAVVGTAKVARGAFPDPTMGQGEEKGGWVAVELEADASLPRPVSLAEIKADPALSGLLLVRHTRLSVMPIGLAEFQRITGTHHPVKLTE